MKDHPEKTNPHRPLPPLGWKPIKERGPLKEPAYALPLHPDPYAIPEALGLPQRRTYRRELDQFKTLEFAADKRKVQMEWPYIVLQLFFESCLPPSARTFH